jgi:hypothetical protein
VRPKCVVEADEAAEPGRLVAQMFDLERAGRILVDGQRVDHAHHVALPQAIELGDHLAVEVGVVEAQYEELNRPRSHG